MNKRKEWVDKFVRNLFDEVITSKLFDKDLLDVFQKLMNEMQEAIPDHANHAKRVAILIWDLVKLLSSRGWKFTNYQLYLLFLAGLGHDFGKLFLPKELFDGHDISKNKAEYEEIKKHSRIVFDLFKECNTDLALIMGSVHNFTNHYGINFSDFPIDYGVGKRNEILNNGLFVSACDFTDANLSRSTQLIGREKLNGISLIEQLEVFFPKMENEIIVEIHYSLFG